MEEEKSNDVLMSKRNKLMLEVASMRKKCPKKLIELEKSIQTKELNNLLSSECSLDLVQQHLIDYKNKENPNQEIKIPNWEGDLSYLKQIMKEVEKRDILLQEAKQNRIDIADLLRKVETNKEHFRLVNTAVKQLESENPLLTAARRDAIKELQRGYPKDQAKEETITKDMNEQVVSEKLIEKVEKADEDVVVPEKMVLQDKIAPENMDEGEVA